jgi:predicted dienelactone hydrolase
MLVRILIGAAAVIAVAAPPFVLPPPTGTHRVATTSWTLTDATREEAFAPGERRRVKVVAWYPTDATSGVRAPYLREGVDEARAFARLIRAAAGSYDSIADVETHALVDAPPLGGARLPLLVFSHGYGGVASAHAALLEDLASHGYAVVAIVQPYESAAARFDDGRVVSMLDEAGSPRAPYRDAIAEWAREDETMTAVTAAANEDEQRRLLRGYLAAIPKTTVALQRWVDDTKLVLDRVAALARGTAAGRLAARVDPRTVGVLGHSMGGVAAADFCVADRRCRAALNLDGIPQYGSMIDRTMPAPMLMVYSARTGRLGASDAIYRRAASQYVRVDVADTRHLDFSDLIFWGGRLREVPALGAIDPVRAAEVTRTIVREYFDQELQRRPSLLLSGAKALDGVTVRRFPRPAAAGPR